MMSWVKLNIRIPGVFFFFFLFERILKFSVAACIPKKPSPNSFEFSHSEQHSRLFWTRYSTFCRGEKLPVSIPPSYNLLGVHCQGWMEVKLIFPRFHVVDHFFPYSFKFFQLPVKNKQNHGKTLNSVQDFSAIWFWISCLEQSIMSLSEWLHLNHLDRWPFGIVTSRAVAQKE